MKKSSIRVPNLRAIWLSAILAVGATCAWSQNPTSFSPTPNAYLSELDKFINASNKKEVKEAFEAFKVNVEGQHYTPEQFTRLHATSNAMLQRKLRANPYFSSFIMALNAMQKRGITTQYFDKWMSILDAALIDMKPSQTNKFIDFLDFSIGLFGESKLKVGEAGSLYWVVTSDNYEFIYKGEDFYVEFAQLDLIGGRKEDSIVIQNTAGIYNPNKFLWKGKKGRVDWGKTGLGREVYCEFGSYVIETKKSEYQVDSATFFYPSFFSAPISGKLVDKVSVTNGKEPSYPRFSSFKHDLVIKNIGNKIKYIGGFSLEGSKVIGTGDKTIKAQMLFYNMSDKLVVATSGMSYVIRGGDEISAQNIGVSIYFGNDSIHHPSADLRFFIPKRELVLSREGSGNSQIKFYNSYHNLDMEVEKIGWQIDSDVIEIGQNKLVNLGGRPKEALFESLAYYNEFDYRRVQNIADFNPITRIKTMSDKNGTRVLDVEALAKFMNPNYSVSTILPLLVELIEDGFIYYDEDAGKVYVREKTFHYSNASIQKVDYDIIRAFSTSNQTHGLLKLSDKSLAINGVKSIVISDSQLVSIKPIDQNILLKGDRNISYNGRLFAGFGIFDGTKFNFNYQRFKFTLDSIKFFELRIPDPSGAVDESGAPVLVSLNTKIEDTSGEVLVDFPANKSSRSPYPQMPIFRSTKPAYVYYDNAATQGGVYKRDKFYFQVKPFEIDSLDGFDPAAVSFTGKLFSAGILPNMDEQLEVQSDLSLGLKTKTPPAGLPVFGGKGTLNGEINLTNTGLFGNGSLSYLTSELKANNFLFLPDKMPAAVKSFTLKEQRTPIQYPSASGEDITVDWRPYKDSMYLRSGEKPFTFFDGKYRFDGNLSLTPSALYGDGVFDWEQAKLKSKGFNFQARGVNADTASVSVKQIGSNENIAFASANVVANIDLDKRIGTFTSNTNTLSTAVPYNQYRTSMDEFVWKMDNKTIDFSTRKGSALFLSVHPKQDSLQFLGKSAQYDLSQNLLTVSGVKFIQAADAFIYPKNELVEVEGEAVMRRLDDAVIIADTSNRYHTIKQAVVNVLGRENYKASQGFYEYNVKKRNQEIKFDRIEIMRIPKGASKGNLVTVGEGKIATKDSFYLDDKMYFQGSFKLRADRQSLQFDGFAKINSPLMGDSAWFRINDNIDRNNVFIHYDVPTNLNGDRLYTGIRIERDTGALYPVIMRTLRSTRDRAIFETKGILTYNDNKDEFYFGDSLKIAGGSSRGNRLTFNRVTGRLDAEGKFNLGSQMEYVQVETAGEGGMTLDGTGNSFDVMMGLKFIFPDKLMSIIVKDLETNSMDQPDADYKKPFVRKALAEFISDDKKLERTYKELDEYERLYLPKEFETYAFFLGNVSMDWDAQRESFVSKKAIGLSYITGKPINRTIKAYIEVRMNRSFDELNFYIESPGGSYYYFNYRSRVMSVYSSNPTFNDAVLALKKEEFQYKMPDGELYEIKATGQSAVQFFLGRIK